ncbi:MAG TPA: hypothetical protein VIL69_22555 [Roseomonas sp.]
MPEATLRALRAVLRLERVNLRRLSGDLDIAPQNLSNALNGRRPLPDSALLKLLEILGLRLTGDRLDIPSRHVRVWTQAPLDQSQLGEELRTGFDGAYAYALFSPYWRDGDSSDIVYEQSRRLVVLSKLDRAVIAVLSPSGDQPLVRPATAPLHGSGGRFMSLETWEALARGELPLEAVRQALSNLQPFDWQQLVEACVASQVSADAVLACLAEHQVLSREVTARLLAQAKVGRLVIPEATLAVLRRVAQGS